MAAADPKLTAALTEKLGISGRTLRRRVQARKQELLSGAPVALHTLAYDAGLDLTAYLSSEELEAVRPFIGAGRATGVGAGSTASPSKQTGGTPAARPKPALVSIGGVNVERLPGMTAARAREAKTKWRKGLPAALCLRELRPPADRAVLEAGFGESWWDQVVPAKIRAAAQKRKDGEGDDPWHGRRGESMIDYTLLSELPNIVSANDDTWPHFKPIFARKSFFEELVNDFNVSRRVSAHMNPISADDRKHIEAAFRKWSATLKAKKDLLP